MNIIRMLVILLLSLTVTATAQTNEDVEDTSRLGFEILQIISPTEIRAWVSQDPMTLDEFQELELPISWFKNQPREASVDGGAFNRSPDGEAEGDILIEEHFGYTWLHTATVIDPRVVVDSERLLSGSFVCKYHEVSYEAESTAWVLVSPEGDAYIRIGRDAERTDDEFTMPDGWQLVEFIVPEDLVFVLPRPTLVMRTDNEDSFQGPVSELSDYLDTVELVGDTQPVTPESHIDRDVDTSNECDL